MTSLQSGDVLASKYRLEEVIGRGGFATIYRAIDTTIDRPVAVKLLELDRDLGAARFTREAKILGELQDGHTMRLFDFGRAADGTLFMVTELLGGQDLSDLLAERGTLTPAEAEHVLRQVLSSLREAHSVGLLHRDVKPSNIRVHTHVGDPMWVTLMDFGIARLEFPGAAKLTATGERVGTAAYMPPEQAVGAHATPASDLFSLGLVIAECLVADLRAVRTSMMGTEPFDFGAPPPLTRALHAMLQVDPADRVKSVDAVLALLEPGRVEPPASGPQAIPRPSGPIVIVEEKPDWRGPAVIAAVVGVLVVAGVFAWWESGQVDPVEPSVRRPNGSALTERVTQPVSPPAEASDMSEPAEDLGDSMDRGCGIVPAEGTNFSKRRTTVGLDVHRWQRYLPDDYDPSKKHPVLLAFHTDNGSAINFANRAELRELADDLDLILIAMRGATPVAWNTMYPDAVEGVLADNRDQACIDPERVFVVGYGSGGFPAENLSCEPWVRGVIMVSHRSIASRLVCPDERKPMAFFQPMKSKHLPIDGGWNCSKTRKHVSLAEQEEYLRARNRCDANGRREVFTHLGSTCFSWDCETSLTVCHVNGGHQFPGSGKRKIDLLGCDGPDPDFPYRGRFAAFLEPLL